MSMLVRFVRSLPFVLAIGLILGAGMVHGDFADRWRKSNELQTMIARIARVPMVCGDWVGVDREKDKITLQQFQRGQIEASVSRRYTNRRTGVMVEILLVCGRVGPIVGHSPQSCYTGNGYTLAKIARFALPPSEGLPYEADFAVGDFAKNGSVISSGLRIFWSFGLRDRWSSPERPRFKFAAERSIYKLYVIRPAFFSAEPLEDDPAKGFIADFIAAVQPVLF